MSRFFTFLLFLLIPSYLFSIGNAGKIAGRIMDGETNTGLPGVNVMLLETKQGAITDMNGYYVILNVPPGKYNLRATMVGYTAYKVSNVEVNIDRTTTMNFEMKTEAIQGKEIQVVASRPIVQKDVAASVTNINETTIQALPVQNITQVVGLQAGIVNSATDGITIRGGGEAQSAFMLDGVNLKDERSMTSYQRISLNSLQEIQVQTGGFSAEYGNARSGVINIVTKEGDRQKYTFAITTQLRPAEAKHFGMSVYDPMSFWNRPYLDPAVCWTGTKNGAWSAAMQQQYQSFDGWNAISNQTLQDDDPTNDLTPEGARQLYLWQHRRQGDIKKPDYNIDAAFGGPVPYVSEMLGNLRFFASYRKENTEYLIPLATDGYKDFNGTMKLTSDITDKLKVVVSGMYGETNGTTNNNTGAAGIFYYNSSIADALHEVNYISTRIYTPDYWCPSEIFRSLISAKATYIFNEKTLAEATLQSNRTKYFTMPNTPRNTDPIYNIAGLWVDEGPWGYYPYPASGIGDQSFRMGFGMSNSRDYSLINTYTFTASLMSQLNEFNQLKAGVEFTYNDQNVKYGSVELTLPTGNRTYEWKRYPIRGAVYALDKLEFEGLVINAGLRMDYSNPNGDWYDLSPYDPYLSNKYGDILDAVAPKKKVDTKVDFSPRLAISHPITENSKLYFNYGHFRAMPSTETMYRIQKEWDKQISYLANPDLDLEKTVQYELGYDHNLFDMFLLHLSAYYKDVSDQAKTIRYTSADGKENYLTTDNTSYADIRGFEVELRKDRGDWVNGFLNYTYMVTTSGYFGYAQYYENSADMRAYIRDNIYQEKPRPQPYARANIEFRTPTDFGPEFAGIKILGDWRISFLPTWTSGDWFTWNPGSKPDISYNMEWNDSYNIDLKITKDIKIWKVNIEFMADISNLTNHKQFSVYGFYDSNDRKAYFESLHLPKSIADALGAPYNTHYGNDKPGDYRDYDTPYDPNSTDDKTKAYIDMPNQSSLTFLNPRNVFLGVRIAFDF
jgi:outer membrane receptor protein involved in Fe transport